MGLPRTQQRSQHKTQPHEKQSKQNSEKITSLQHRRICEITHNKNFSTRHKPIPIPLGSSSKNSRQLQQKATSINHNAKLNHLCLPLSNLTRHAITTNIQGDGGERGGKERWEKSAKRRASKTSDKDNSQAAKIQQNHRWEKTQNASKGEKRKTQKATKTSRQLPSAKRKTRPWQKNNENKRATAGKHPRKHPSMGEKRKTRKRARKRAKHQNEKQ